jgi:glycerate kinase
VTRVLCAPDKFRGSISAPDAARAMAAGATAAGWECGQHPIADGGEGTAQAVLATRGGERFEVQSVDALNRPSLASWARLSDGNAIAVAADAIGLAALNPAERDPLAASSRGLAAPILAAAAAGARTVLVFIGGTANMDGGLGLLAALGAHVRDSGGARLSGRGEDLAAVASIDLGPARAALADVDLVLATDVTSPLFGPDGAAHVFGPQKGADQDTVELLDRGLRRLAPLLGAAAEQPGAGAAGGLGAALMALGAQRRSGAETVLEISGFAAALADVDLCITAEGSVDRSTGAGKAVSAVLRACRDKGIPCVVLGGAVMPEAEQLYALGAAGLFAIGRRPQALPDALATTARDLQLTTRAVCELAAQAAGGSGSESKKSAEGTKNSPPVTARE